MSLAELRERALSRTQDAILRESLCLDDQLAERITSLSTRLDQLAARRESVLAAMKEDTGDRRLSSNPVAEVDADIKTVDAELSRARAAADDATIVVVFRRLQPAHYERLVQSCRRDDGTVDSAGFADLLCRECYVRTTSIDDEDLELSWDELVEKALSHGDSDHLFTMLLAHNQSSVALPFSPRRSASRGRAKK